MLRRIVCLTVLVTALGSTASAQLISIKTVPVSQADQFAIFPSRNQGMGDLSIAVRDPLLDPFVNPAKGSRLGELHFFGSPALYTVSSEAGGGRTFPIAAAMRSGSWFGGLALALQEVDAARQPFFGPFPLAEGDILPPGPQPGSLAAQSHGNQLAFAMVGKALPEARLSFGGSVLWAGLNAIDGVDLLYGNSAAVNQFGDAMDLRFGVLKEFDGERSLEALVLYDRFRMTHDVTYLDFVWDPATQQLRQKARLEQNRDWTDVWGVHLEYERPLSTPGWRVGWLVTTNRMSHPKIPNYELMNIPRDPGNSYAFNVGLGVSREKGPATFGIDAIYEPIWSHTWADAAGPVVNRLGDTIPAGGKTIENDFRFSNALLRMGLTRDVGQTFAFQMGLMVRSIHYWLTQYDNVQISRRNQVEQWVEWTPTWGLGLRFPELEIRYQGRVTNGTGRPGVVPNRGGIVALDAAVPGNILVAPSGPLSLGEVRVVTHQVSLSLPLR